METQEKSSSQRQQVAFIACSKRKKAFPDKAKNLYQGCLFQKALQYCQGRFGSVYILSAKYGLVELEQVIAPYEQMLKNQSASKRRRWARMVNGQLRDKGISGEFWFFTGEKYSESFTGKKPLQGLSLGKQLQWFNQHMSHGGFQL